MWPITLDDGDDNLQTSLFLVLVFALSVAAMAAVTVTDQTALNERYINDTFEEEGVQQEMTIAMQKNLAEQFENSSFNSEEIAAEVITKKFASTELQRNINETVAYLRGDADSFDLAINYEPVRLSVLELTEPAEHDAINESVPPEVDIQVDPENSGLATARMLMKQFPTVLISSVLLVLITVGAILYVSPNYRDTARNLGLGIVTSSLIVFFFGVVLLIIGRELTITTIGEVRIDPKILFDGVLAVAEGIGMRMLAYSGVLFLVGLLLLMISHSENTGDKSYSDEQESRVTTE